MRCSASAAPTALWAAPLVYSPTRLTARTISAPLRPVPATVLRLASNSSVSLGPSRARAGEICSIQGWRWNSAQSSRARRSSPARQPPAPSGLATSASTVSSITSSSSALPGT